MTDQTSRLVLKIEDAAKAADDVDRLADELERLDKAGDRAAHATDNVGKQAREASPAVDRLGREATQGSRSMRRMGAAAGFAGKAVGGLIALGFGAGVATILSFTKATLDSIDAIQKLSIETGYGVEALSQMQFAGQLADVSISEMQTSFRYLSRNISEAAQGFGEGKKAFDSMNISVSELQRLKPEDQFLVMVEALNRVEDQGDKTSLAMRLFGRSGSALLKITDEGAEGLLAMREEASKLGVTLTDEMANAAAQTNDDFTRMSAVMLGQKQVIVTQLAPALQGIAQFFTEQLPKAINWSIGAYYKLQEVASGTLSALSGSLAATNKNLEESQTALGSFGRSLRDILTVDIADLPELFSGELDRGAHAQGLQSQLQQQADILGSMSQQYAETGGKVKEFQTATIDSGSALEQVNALLADMETNLSGIDPVAQKALKSIQSALTTNQDRYNLEVDKAERLQSMGLLSEAEVDQYKEVLAKKFLDVGKAAGGALAKGLEDTSAAMQSAGDRIFAETRTAQENYVSSILEAKELLEGEFIGEDTFQRYVESQRDAFDKANSQLSDHARETQDTLRKIRGALVTEDQQFQGELDEATRLRQLGLLTKEELSAYTAYLEEHFERTGYTLAHFAEDAGASLERHFADFLFDPFDKGLKGMVDGFTKSMQRIAADAAAQEIFKSLSSGFSGLAGGSGWIGAVAGGLGLATGADGGPLSVGTPTLVGERGPEIIMPQTPGTIIPNDQLGALVGASSPTINMNMTVNTQGSGQQDKRSLNQIQAAAYAGMQRALSRAQ